MSVEIGDGVAEENGLSKSAHVFSDVSLFRVLVEIAGIGEDLSALICEDALEWMNAVISERRELRQIERISIATCMSVF